MPSDREQVDTGLPWTTNFAQAWSTLSYDRNDTLSANVNLAAALPSINTVYAGVGLNSLAWPSYVHQAVSVPQNLADPWCWGLPSPVHFDEVGGAPSEFRVQTLSYASHFCADGQNSAFAGARELAFSTCGNLTINLGSNLSSLVDECAVVESRLEHAEAELSSLKADAGILMTTTTCGWPDCDAPKFGLYAYDETMHLYMPYECAHVAIEHCRQQWRFLRVEVLERHVEALRCRLLSISQAIKLRIRELALSYWPQRLAFKERVWSLLHGSHPPRDDARQNEPAFGEFGRVSRLLALFR
jgi:hypothetical protein